MTVSPRFLADQVVDRPYVWILRESTRSPRTLTLKDADGVVVPLVAGSVAVLQVRVTPEATDDPLLELDSAAPDAALGSIVVDAPAGQVAYTLSDTAVDDVLIAAGFERGYFDVRIEEPDGNRWWLTGPVPAAVVVQRRVVRDVAP